MDAATREALEGSIRKWEAVVEGSGADEGGSNCPLCVLADSRNEDGGCAGCPVFEATGEEECGDTPFFLWRGVAKASRHGRTFVVHDSASRAAAQAERDFLVSLRPGGEEGA